MAGNPHETIWPEKVAERGTARITCTLKDELGVSPSSLSSLTLTLYNRATGAILNSVNGKNILNTGGGTYTYDAPSGVGTVAYQMDPADNQLEVVGAEGEIHVALFRWTYASGAKAGWHRVVLAMVGELKVT